MCRGVIPCMWIHASANLLLGKVLLLPIGQQAGWSPDLAQKCWRKETSLKIQILWDVTLCRLVSGYPHRASQEVSWAAWPWSWWHHNPLECWGTAFTVTEHHITEDLICSSTSQNLRYRRRMSAYAEITAWAVTVLEWRVLKCIGA